MEKMYKIEKIGEYVKIKYRAEIVSGKVDYEQIVYDYEDGHNTYDDDHFFETKEELEEFLTKNDLSKNTIKVHVNCEYEIQRYNVYKYDENEEKYEFDEEFEDDDRCHETITESKFVYFDENEIRYTIDLLEDFKRFLLLKSTVNNEFLKNFDNKYNSVCEEIKNYTSKTCFQNNGFFDEKLLYDSCFDYFCLDSEDFYPSKKAIIDCYLNDIECYESDYGVNEEVDEDEYEKALDLLEEGNDKTIDDLYDIVDKTIDDLYEIIDEFKECL